MSKLPLPKLAWHDHYNAAQSRGKRDICRVFIPYDGTKNLCIRWLIKSECSKMRLWKGGKLVWTFGPFSSWYLLRLQVEILVNASWGRYHSVQAEPRAKAPPEFQTVPKVTPPGNARVHRWHWPGPKVKKYHIPSSTVCSPLTCNLSDTLLHVWVLGLFLHILHLHSLLLATSSLGKRNPELVLKC